MPDEIYVDPSVTAKAIRVGDKCYTREKGSEQSATVHAADATFQSCQECSGAGDGRPVPDHCPDGLASSYVVTISDTTFSPPGSGHTYFAPAQSVVVTRLGDPAACLWDGDGSGATVDGSPGPRPTDPHVSLSWQTYGDYVPGVGLVTYPAWQVTVAVADQAVIWDFYEYTRVGATPAGGGTYQPRDPSQGSGTATVS